MKKIIVLSIGILLFIGILGRAILHMHGLQVTSWWRSPWKNAEIGGNWLSLHLIGWAYDVVPINGAIRAALAKYPWKVVVESDHIHLQIL